jgi:hypothetical protein
MALTSRLPTGEKGVLARSISGQDIKQFYLAEKPEIADDVGIFARVRGQDGSDSSWLGLRWHRPCCHRWDSAIPGTIR